MDMALVKPSGNRTTELRIRAALARAGIGGYETQAVDLPGKPDILFRGRLAVFTDGCFWHGCDVHYRRPKRNSLYWARKVKANRARDIRDTSRLAGMGYRIMRVWEHDLKDTSKLKDILLRIQRALCYGESSELGRWVWRVPHSVPDYLMWCGPCFAAVTHDIKDLTGHGVYTSAKCSRCGTVSTRVNGISIGKGGRNGAGIE